MSKLVKIAVYTPISHSEKIREALAKSGAGHIGNYDYCSFSVKGTGRFRGGEGATPYIGEPGTVEKVEEERIETICYEKDLPKILEELKAQHPYDEPAIDIYPLLNDQYL